MKAYFEVDANYMRSESWSGAKSTIEALTDAQIEEILYILDEQYPDGLSTTELNDIFWFEDDFIAECLGFECWEHLEKANSTSGTVYKNENDDYLTEQEAQEEYITFFADCDEEEQEAYSTFDEYASDYLEEL